MDIDNWFLTVDLRAVPTATSAPQLQQKWRLYPTNQPGFGEEWQDVPRIVRGTTGY